MKPCYSRFGRAGPSTAGVEPPTPGRTLSYYDPGKFRIDPAALPPAVQAAMPGNRASLAVYAGTAFADPGLAAITVPTLVAWGEADRICDPDYGRAYAAAIPGAQYQIGNRRVGRSGRRQDVSA